MSLHTRFRVNRPNVILETFEDEAVIVHLDSGNYYSLDGSGVELWVLLEKGISTGEIVEAIACRYQTDHGLIEPAVSQFVAELLRENLLVELPDDPAELLRVPNYSIAYGPDQRPFVAPVLQKFTDMQELLLLDPIHEVDTTGWPHPAPDQVETARKVG